MKRRADSFFGVHLDYHAKPTDGLVQGKNLKESDIRDICRLLKPDFIQIDCKGHPGWASYPTEIGNAMPEFCTDTLAMWRRVTREENVALYMHYSGVYDVKYCNENPDQTIMKPDGTLQNGATRLDGKYSEEILIPQLLELAGKYEVDGVWVDGDCWMACPDFHPETIKAFEKETGICLNGEVPKERTDPYYDEYREYNRELYRRYLRGYVDAVHEKYPDFQIASNWAFSDHMPEKVCANVDFLSGDLNPSNSFNSARYAARALAQQNEPWDLMSWNFRNCAGGKRAYVAKHPNQIMQEAASVIALGGAFQDYVPQYRDGAPNMVELKNLVKVSEFVRERKPYCFRGRPLRQSALLLSTYDRHREDVNLYSRTGYERVMGACALLCDVGQSLEIVCEHTLEENAYDYETIIIPELFVGLAKKTVDDLFDYAKKGGKLVLIGKNTCKIFSNNESSPFSVNDMYEFLEQEAEKTNNGHESRFTGTYKPYNFTIDKNELGALFSPCEIVADNKKTWAVVLERDLTGSTDVVATMPFGSGSITAIGFDIGAQYLNGTQYLHRSLVKQIFDSLYTPIVRVESVCGRLEVVALDKDGSLMIQLVNGGGAHANSLSASDDYIPPVLDIELSIGLEHAPSALILQPSGKELSFEYKDERAYVSIDRIDVHSIIEVRK